jgi:hypothetical protein
MAHKGNSTTPFTSVSTLTSASDSDRATLFAAGASVSNCNLQGVSIPQDRRDNGTIAIDITGANANPIVWSNIAASTGAGTANSYGYIRFTTRVDP